jgi:hypothetical protein
MEPKGLFPRDVNYMEKGRMNSTGSPASMVLPSVVTFRWPLSQAYGHGVIVGTEPVSCDDVIKKNGFQMTSSYLPK